MIGVRARRLRKAVEYYEALESSIEGIYEAADATLAWAEEYLARPDVKRTLPGYNKFEDDVE